MHRILNGGERYRWAGLALLLLASLAIALAASRSQAEVATQAAGEKPTVVLVNGAWATNGSWTGVIERLQAQGYSVIAPPDPLQSLKGDAATSPIC